MWILFESLGRLFRIYEGFWEGYFEFDRFYGYGLLGRRCYFEGDFGSEWMYFFLKRFGLLLVLFLGFVKCFYY